MYFFCTRKNRINVLIPLMMSVGIILLSGFQQAGASGKKHLVLQLRGEGTEEMRSYDTTGDGIPDTYAGCFDVELFNPANGKKVGNGTDCLDVMSIDDDGNVSLTGTGFFHIGNSTLVVQGATTVRPVLQETTRDGINFTHITGANSDGGVLYGTKRFRNATGKVRLSGQVDMSRLSTEGVIYFDCIFIVDFY